MIHRLLLILFALLCCAWNPNQLAGGADVTGPTASPTVSPTVSPTSTPTSTATPTSTPGGGPSVTLDDDFATDNGDWAQRSGLTVCGVADGEMSFADEDGICHYTQGSSGSQPTSVNQWAVQEIGTVGESHTGIAVRGKSTLPGTDDYNYVARCTGTLLLIRVCDSDISCQTLGDGGTCFAQEGDQIAIAVSGTGTSTEICAWWWVAGTETWSDPTTWKSADFCVSDDGLINNADMTPVAGTPSVIEDWGSNSNECLGAPDACKGYADTYKDTSPYAGSIAGIWDVEWFISGDL